MTRARLGWLLAAAALGFSATPACDYAHKDRHAAGHVPAVVSITPAIASAGAHAADCDAEHSSQPHQPLPTATALSEEARHSVTVLRIFAHSAAVIIRKDAQGWSITGPQACRVSSGRMDLALNNLSKLTAVPSAERPAGGGDFDLQIVAQSGDRPVLHLNIAGRNGENKDLVVLLDDSTFRVSGLDRQLLSPEPRAWCEPG
jgi:hypothetical protein